MFDGRLPSFANTRSMRVAGGLGTVARVVGDAQEIYDQRIPVDDALRRIEGLYKPYHRLLRRLMTRIHREFGAAVLVDCHSMPSTAGPKDERPRADIVIGDRYGTSCVGIVAEVIEHVLRERGYVVSRNKPYAGGFITEHYGNPAAGLHTVQLEVNRALYMDERRFERGPNFANRRPRPRGGGGRASRHRAPGTAPLPRRCRVGPRFAARVALPTKQACTRRGRSRLSAHRRLSQSPTIANMDHGECRKEKRAASMLAAQV